MKNEIILQITSGRGPEECCLVVAQILKTMLHEAKQFNIDYDIIRRNNAIEPGTIVSALISFKGKGVKEFTNSWIGTIQWIGLSPYRKYHKRKNWFAGVDLVDTTSLVPWNENDVSFQTLRSSGPGGQHVNKTESAVRAIHNPTGLQVLTSNSRSQLQNKKLALERLQKKLAEWQIQKLNEAEQSGWQQHINLERGNPVRIFKGREFAAIQLNELIV
jgi:peptide chain release factor